MYVNAKVMHKSICWNMPDGIIATNQFEKGTRVCHDLSEESDPTELWSRRRNAADRSGTATCSEFSELCSESGPIRHKRRRRIKGVSSCSYNKGPTSTHLLISTLRITEIATVYYGRCDGGTSLRPTLERFA